MCSCSQKIEKNILTPVHFQEEKFGTTVFDDYRFLESTKKNDDISNWMNKEDSTTKTYFTTIPNKERLISIQREYDQAKKFSTSNLYVTKGGTYYYLKRLAGENNAQLYRRTDFKKEEELLFDPKRYNEEKDFVINAFVLDSNEEHILISLTSDGKEISDLVVLHLPSKKILPTTFKNAWPRVGGDPQWSPDSKGFYYTKFPVINPKSSDFKKKSTVVYQSITESNESTPILTQQLKKQLGIKETDISSVQIDSQMSTYATLSIYTDNTYKDVYYTKSNTIQEGNWKPLFRKTDSIQKYVVRGDSLIYSTSKNAPNFRICMTSIVSPDFEEPKELVPESKDSSITNFIVNREGVFFVRSKNGVDAHLYHLDVTENIEEIQLPSSYGSIDVYTAGSSSSLVWFYCWGWAMPKTRYEFSNGEVKEVNLEPSYHTKGLENLVVEEVEVKGHDGVMIPLSIIYKKGTPLNGSRRVLLDGYGAYGLSLEPSFSLRRMLWVHEGGVYAVSHVRGGGEKGNAWHKGGLKETKPNTWKDFISCANYLIDNDYTKPKQLAIWSGSAGGILIGRAITERPDLFRAAIVEFGVLNMLRYEQIQGSTNQRKEFGTVNDSIGFKTLYEMDAFHHLKENIKYPATLLTHGLNDPRVPIWQTLKFAARIQKYSSSNYPNLIWMIRDTGHATDDTKEKEFERYAHIMAFALRETGHPDYQPE